MVCIARPSIVSSTEAQIIGTFTLFSFTFADLWLWSWVSEYRKPDLRSTSHWIDLCVLIVHSVPFFFEPNFDAIVKPLDAVLRMRNKNDPEYKSQKVPVVYGDFLVGKVRNNFAADSKKKY